MTVATLPPEIIILVLEKLDHRRQRLCSLTCKAWASLCKPLLLRRINLWGQPHYDRAYRLFMMHSPHLRHHVRELRLVNLMHPISLAHEGCWFSDAQFFGFIQSFPLITSLAIDGIDVFTSPFVHALTLQAQHSTITRLHLGFIPGFHPTKLLRILRLFSATLQSLTLSGVVYRPTSQHQISEEQEASLLQLPVLHTLTMRDCYIRFPSDQPQMPQLRVVKMKTFSPTVLLPCVTHCLDSFIALVHPARFRLPGVGCRPLLVKDLYLSLMPYSEDISEIEDIIRKLVLPASMETLHIGMLNGARPNRIAGNVDIFLSKLHCNGVLRSVTFWDDKLEDNGADFYHRSLPKLHRTSVLSVSKGSLFRQFEI